MPLVTMFWLDRFVCPDRCCQVAWQRYHTVDNRSAKSLVYAVTAEAF